MRDTGLARTFDKTVLDEPEIRSNGDPPRNDSYRAIVPYPLVKSMRLFAILLTSRRPGSVI